MGHCCLCSCCCHCCCCCSGPCRHCCDQHHCQHCHRRFFLRCLHSQPADGWEAAWKPCLPAGKLSGHQQALRQHGQEQQRKCDQGSGLGVGQGRRLPLLWLRWIERRRGGGGRKRGGRWHWLCVRKSTTGMQGGRTGVGKRKRVDSGSNVQCGEMATAIDHSIARCGPHTVGYKKISRKRAGMEQTCSSAMTGMHLSACRPHQPNQQWPWQLLLHRGRSPGSS